MSYSICPRCGGWIPGSDELDNRKCKCHRKTVGTQPASTNTAMGQLLWEVQEMCRNGISINQVQFDIYNKIEKSGLAQQPHS